MTLRRRADTTIRTHKHVVSAFRRTFGVRLKPDTTVAIGADQIDDTQTPGWHDDPNARACSVRLQADLRGPAKAGHYTRVENIRVENDVSRHSPPIGISGIQKTTAP